MTLSVFPRISVYPAIRGGRPAVAGTRMQVRDVFDMLTGGGSKAEIVSGFPYIGLDDIRACLRLAARSTDHPIVTAAE